MMAPLCTLLILHRQFKKAQNSETEPHKKFEKLVYGDVSSSFIVSIWLQLCFGLSCWDSYFLGDHPPDASTFYFQLLYIAMLWPIPAVFALYLYAHYLNKLRILSGEKPLSQNQQLSRVKIETLVFLSLTMLLAILRRLL